MNTKRKAFTLIELLVVIAIIALLVSILLPSLAKAKEMARSMVCITNVKSQGTALEFYGNDFGVYCRNVICNSKNNAEYLNNRWGIALTRLGYTGRSDPNYSWGAMETEGTADQIFVCPSQADVLYVMGEARTGYGMNVFEPFLPFGWAPVDVGSKTDLAAPLSAKGYVKIGNMQQPSAKVYLYCGEPNTGNYGINFYKPDKPSAVSNPFIKMTDVHLKKTNFLLADMHAENASTELLSRDPGDNRTPDPPGPGPWRWREWYL